MFSTIKKSNCAVLSFFMMLACSAGLVQSAEAQSMSTPPANASTCNYAAAATASRPVKRYTGTQYGMYETQKLQSQVSLQSLPEYCGRNGKATFESGFSYPRLKAGQCVVMRFLSKDRTEDVMLYYRGSLQQSGWQVNEMQSNSKQMTATRKQDGLICTFCVFPSFQPGYRSSFEIKYLFTGISAKR